MSKFPGSSLTTKAMTTSAKMPRFQSTRAAIRHLNRGFVRSRPRSCLEANDPSQFLTQEFIRVRMAKAVTRRITLPTLRRRDVSMTVTRSRRFRRRTIGSLPGSEAPRRGDRLLRRAPHLGPESSSSSPPALRNPRRRALPGWRTMDQLPQGLLPTRSGPVVSVPQVVPGISHRGL